MDDNNGLGCDYDEVLLFMACYVLWLDLEILHRHQVDEYPFPPHVEGNNFDGPNTGSMEGEINEDGTYYDSETIAENEDNTGREPELPPRQPSTQIPTAVPLQNPSQVPSRYNSQPKGKRPRDQDEHAIHETVGKYLREMTQQMRIRNEKENNESLFLRVESMPELSLELQSEVCSYLAEHPRTASMFKNRNENHLRVWIAKHFADGSYVP